MLRLANLYSEQAKYGEAEEYYKKALTIRQKTLDENHPDIAETYNDLANLYSEQAK